MRELGLPQAQGPQAIPQETLVLVSKASASADLGMVDCRVCLDSIPGRNPLVTQPAPDLWMAACFFVKLSKPF